MQALIVCFFIIKDKERAPFGGGEPRQACDVGKKNNNRFKVPACAGMTTVLESTKISPLRR